MGLLRRVLALAPRPAVAAFGLAPRFVLGARRRIRQGEIHRLARPFLHFTRLRPGRHFGFSQRGLKSPDRFVNDSRDYGQGVCAIHGPTLASRWRRAIAPLEATDAARLHLI